MVCAAMQGRVTQAHSVDQHRRAAPTEEVRGLTAPALVDAYANLLFDADPTVRDHAAREWCAWEDAYVSLAPGHLPNAIYEDPEYVR